MRAHSAMILYRNVVYVVYNDDRVIDEALQVLYEINIRRKIDKKYGQNNQTRSLWLARFN